MASPALIRTWQPLLNQTLPSEAVATACKRELWTIKALLCGEYPGTTGFSGKWTVAGSSNGTTGAMDSVDRWGSTFVEANLVASTTPATAHSWIVLKSPTGGLNNTYHYLTLALNTPNAYQPFIGLKTVAPTFTGPTTTQSTYQAAASDSLGSYYTSATALAGYVAFNAGSANPTTPKFHFCLADNGAFWFGYTDAGAAVCKYGLAVFTLKSASLPAWGTSQVLFLNGTYSASQAGLSPYAATSGCRVFGPTGYTLVAGGTIAYLLGTAYWAGSSWATPINQLDTNLGSLLFPLGLGNTTGAYGFYFGELEDVYGGGIQNWATKDTDERYSAFSYGGSATFWLPCPGASNYLVA